MALLLSLLLGVFSVSGSDGEALEELPQLVIKGQLAKNNLIPVVPTKVKAPSVPNRFIGTRIHMYFWIEKDGRVSHIRSDASSLDVDESCVSAAMREALNYWQFEPARRLDTGEAVKIKVALPVEIVEPGNGNSNKYAAISLKDMPLLAVLD
ncbi:MAG: hypothetical protein AB3N33_01250 [Puniceicoccaceae bacterium]